MIKKFKDKIKLANLIKSNGLEFDPNKKIRPFGYNSKEKIYILEDNRCKCDSCEIHIKEVGFLCCEWGFIEKEQILCLKCNKQYNPLGKISQTLTFIIGNLNDADKIIIPVRPNLVNRGGITVIDAAPLKSEEVIDKTKLAGRATLLGCKIGKDPNQFPYGGSLIALDFDLEKRD